MCRERETKQPVDWLMLSSCNACDQLFISGTCQFIDDNITWAFAVEYVICCNCLRHITLMYTLCHFQCKRLGHRILWFLWFSHAHSARQNGRWSGRGPEWQWPILGGWHRRWKAAAYSWRQIKFLHNCCWFCRHLLNAQNILQDTSLHRLRFELMLHFCEVALLRAHRRGTPWCCGSRRDFIRWHDKVVKIILLKNWHRTAVNTTDGL